MTPSEILHEAVAVINANGWRRRVIDLIPEWQTKEVSLIGALWIVRENNDICRDDPSFIAVERTIIGIISESFSFPVGSEKGIEMTCGHKMLIWHANFYTTEYEVRDVVSRAIAILENPCFKIS